LQYCEAEHALPQAPQFWVSPAGMQLVPQYTPLSHWHPPLHCSPSAHTLPQVPQLSTSLAKSAQSPPQLVSPLALHPQAPPAQA
jgi:hypothetical protein